MRSVLISCFLLCFASCKSQKTVVLTCLDHYEIRSDEVVKNTRFGGISGIDYDAKKNVYYLVSDDRSAYGPARFYETSIQIRNNKIDTILFDSLTPLLNDSGTVFKKETTDLESIRFNPELQLMLAGDEGGNNGKAAIKIFDLNGRYLRDLKMPSLYTAAVRSNKSFESIGLSKDYQSVFYASEAPLLTDEATPGHKALLRIMVDDFNSGKPKRELLYWLEKIPKRPRGGSSTPNVVSDNGLAEIECLKDDRLLTLERSGMLQKDSIFHYVCKVFYTIPAKTSTLRQGTEVYKTRKTKVFDFSSLPYGSHNVEGMTVGPVTNGNQYMLFVSDNNFKENIPTMIYLFKITYK